MIRAITPTAIPTIEMSAIRATWARRRDVVR
jgi:hypothetical protein